MRGFCLAVCLILPCASPVLAANPGEPGFNYRILVDKVYSQGNDRSMLTDADMKAIAGIGFNVISPRLNGDCPQIVREQAGLAKQAGLYYMGWLRGSLPATRAKWAGVYGGRSKIDLDSLARKYGDPLRFVSASGDSYDLLSPNSDELWDQLTAYILLHAKLSRELPIIGVFLDFEIYARPIKRWFGHLYPLSYDQKIWNDFFVSRGEKVPPLAAGQRADYLAKHALAKEFQAYQIQQWRGRLRRIRQAVDAINPGFQFAIYPSSYTLFVNEAVWHELGTKAAPLLAAEHYTYWKGAPRKDENPDCRFVSVEEGLELNRNFVRQCISKYRARAVPSLVLGGIDPIDAGGDDPLFQARSAVVMSRAGAGYWVFFEGPGKKSSWMSDFSKWFKQANAAIADGTFHLPE